MRGNILTLAICCILWRVSTDIICPLLTLYIIALASEYKTVGQVIAISARTILYPLGGYIADYQGCSKVMPYMTTSTVHAVTNTIIFSVLAPPIIQRISRLSKAFKTGEPKQETIQA
jgi:hypothetical protein